MQHGHLQRAASDLNVQDVANTSQAYATARQRLQRAGLGPTQHLER